MITPVTLAAGPVPGPLVAAPLAVPQTRHQPHVSAGAELVFASPLPGLPLKPGHIHVMSSLHHSRYEVCDLLEVAVITLDVWKLD